MPVRASWMSNAQARAAPQLQVYIAAAPRVGCAREEIPEVIMQMAVYAGCPTALCRVQGYSRWVSGSRRRSLA